MMKAIFLSAFIVIIGSLSAAHAQVASTQRAIPYASAAAALEGLRAKRGVVFSNQGDWLIAKDTDGSMWSFTPANHPANPSVARRTLVEQNGRFRVETRLMCEAEWSACNKLNEDYVALDKRMIEAIHDKVTREKQTRDAGRA
jgi:hypothetical protein